MFEAGCASASTGGVLIPVSIIAIRRYLRLERDGQQVATAVYFSESHRLPLRSKSTSIRF